MFININEGGSTNKPGFCLDTKMGMIYFSYKEHWLLFRTWRRPMFQVINGLDNFLRNI